MEVGRWVGVVSGKKKAYRDLFLVNIKSNEGTDSGSKNCNSKIPIQIETRLSSLTSCKSIYQVRGSWRRKFTRKGATAETFTQL